MLPCKMAEPIEMPSGAQICVSPRNQVSDGGAHWCHLVNTIDQCAVAALRADMYSDGKDEGRLNPNYPLDSSLTLITKACLYQKQVVSQN